MSGRGSVGRSLRYFRDKEEGGELGRKRSSYIRKKTGICLDCGKPIYKISKRCRECSIKFDRRFYPEK